MSAPRVSASVVSLALLAALGASAQPDDGASCVAAVRAKVAAANPEEVCRLLIGRRDPTRGTNFDAVFDFRAQDLGDGTEAYVFTHRPGGDAYAFLPDVHFVRQGEKLVLLFDGRGVPGKYLTDRPRVNGRWQIERVATSDIPGLYKKREAERWFWNGSEYAKAFSRVKIDSAANPKLSGTETVWDPGSEEAYRSAGRSWSHRVASGDTLSAIAKRYGASVDEIMRQNGIRSAASLRLGQELRFEAWKVNAR